MLYKYICGEEVIDVFVYAKSFFRDFKDGIHDCVTVYYINGKLYDRSIRKDEQGRFFTWNKHKIYLNDWIRISIKELKKRVDRGEHITANELSQAILSDGVENARFLVPMNKVSCSSIFGISFFDGHKDTVCKIEESWNREVRQNYKLVLVPVKYDGTTCRREEFYTMDFAGFINSGIVKIVV